MYLEEARLDGRVVERGRGSIITLGSMSGLISNRPQRRANAGL